jgi:hypothetical protein
VERYGARMSEYPDPAFTGEQEFVRNLLLCAQRWHETDHGSKRGKRKKRPHVETREDDFDPAVVTEKFQDCPLCHPGKGWNSHNNPYWFRVVAWETPCQ